MPVLTNLFGNRERLALALDTTNEELNRVYREREKRLTPPIIVPTGPIQESVMTGDQVDLTKLPIVHHKSGDAGAYVTAGVTTVKDPDTQIRNAGMYRYMLKNKNQMGVHLAEASHVYYIYRKYCEKKQNMPIAITIGAHPAFYLGSLSFCGIDTDEYEVMGGLFGSAMEVVKCRSVDLEVPADGEICLEGYIDWEKREPEGPFGEWHTLYGEAMSYPVATITAVTMRHDPIYHDLCSGDTVKKGSNMMRVIVGISGASGIIYGIRLLEAFKAVPIETHLIMSEWAEKILALETDCDLSCVNGLATVRYDNRDMAAPVASGSFLTAGMVISPCSMKTLAGIANGYSQNLLERAADVTIKEGRKLVLVPRETPLSAVHLENMLKLARMGVVIAPPMPAFYINPKQVCELVDHHIGKIMDQFGFSNTLVKRWQEEPLPMTTSDR